MVIKLGGCQRQVSLSRRDMTKTQTANLSRSHMLLFDNFASSDNSVMCIWCRESISSYVLFRERMKCSAGSGNHVRLLNVLLLE
jgi:hypothetical protein